MAECVVNKTNLGLSQCNKLPAMPRGMITTPVNFQFTPAQLADATAFKTALQNALVNPKSSRVYLWAWFKNFENISEEAIYEDTPLAYQRVRDGQYRFRFHISESMCYHKAMYTHKSNNGRVFLIDSENQIVGTVDDAGNFQGFLMSLLNTEKMVISDGSVSTKSPVVVALANNKELDQSGFILDSSIASVVDDVYRLTDVTLTISNKTAAAFDVTVASSCDGTGIDGLVLADFNVLTALGAAQQPTTVTAKGNGVYTLARTGNFVTGSVNLVAAASLTVKAYESTGAVALTIP